MTSATLRTLLAVCYGPSPEFDHLRARTTTCAAELLALQLHRLVWPLPALPWHGWGGYLTSRDQVYVSTRLSGVMRTQVLAHEAVHWTGIRLGRPMYDPECDHALEEAVAELGACKLLRRFGVEPVWQATGDHVCAARMHYGFANWPLADLLSDEAVDFVLDALAADYAAA